jgi:hypothetical protein
MTPPPEPPRDPRELEREMEMIEREGGGPGESAPLRRLGILLLVVLVIAGLWYLLR